MPECPEIIELIRARFKTDKLGEIERLQEEYDQAAEADRDAIKQRIRTAIGTIASQVGGTNALGSLAKGAFDVGQAAGEVVSAMLMSAIDAAFTAYTDLAASVICTGATVPSGGPASGNHYKASYLLAALVDGDDNPNYRFKVKFDPNGEPEMEVSGSGLQVKYSEGLPVRERSSAALLEWRVDDCPANTDRTLDPDPPMVCFEVDCKRSAAGHYAITYIAFVYTKRTCTASISYQRQRRQDPV